MSGSEHITIDLPASDAAFIRSFAVKAQMRLDDVFDYLVRTLRHATDRDIDPMIRTWAGILPPDSDIDALRMQHLADKYLRNDRQGTENGDTAYLSLESLSDWKRPEEEKAWAYLQKPQ